VRPSCRDYSVIMPASATGKDRGRLVEGELVTIEPLVGRRVEP